MADAREHKQTTDRTLTVHCAKCQGIVSLEFTGSSEDSSPRSQTWDCPYCAAQNTGDFCGELVWAVRQPHSDVDISPEAVAERLRTSRAKRRDSH